MTAAFRKTRSVGAVVLTTIATCVYVAAQSGAELGTQSTAATPRTHVASTPENVVFGVFPIDRQPVAKVRSGDEVRIDTLSHRGTIQQEDPVTFLGALGVKLSAAETRRNVATSGVPLNHLVGQRFRVGDVVLKGGRLNFPCRYIEELLGLPIYIALINRSGLNCWIERGGIIRKGDPIELVPEADAAA